MATHTAMSDPLVFGLCISASEPAPSYGKGQSFYGSPLSVGFSAMWVCSVWNGGKSDVGAIKQAMKYLKEGEKVLLYPEGHRIHESRGEQGEAKNGAAMLAVRCGVPILPVYVPEQKPWFRRTTVVIGEPYMPQVSSRKGDGRRV